MEVVDNTKQILTEGKHYNNRSHKANYSAIMHSNNVLERVCESWWCPECKCNLFLGTSNILWNHWKQRIKEKNMAPQNWVFLT